MKLSKIILTITSMLSLYGFSLSASPNDSKRGATGMNITSTAFKEGSTIPKEYTCEGQDISPPLAWSNVPAGTQSLALISDDPDAPMGTWVHWVIYNLLPETLDLPEGVPPDRELKNGSLQGINDFRKIGYGGPCPPRGTHRYFFKLYALDAKLNLPSGVTKKDLLKAMEGHVLAEVELVGTFRR